MAGLLGTQRALAKNPNNFLINLQDQLSEEYNVILQIEEELRAIGPFLGKEIQVTFTCLPLLEEVRIELPAS